MNKILTITMNPALDVSTEVDHVEPLLKLRCGPAKREPGGGGINVARVVKRLGGNAVTLFPMGGYTGELLGHLVADEGLDCIKIPTSGETRENFTATESVSNQQYRFVLKGPQMTEEECTRCLEALRSELPSASLLVASGSLPPGAFADFYAAIGQMASNNHVPFILDTSGDALAKALDSPLSLIKPNLRELEDLTGANLETEQQQINACHQLVAAGKVAAVALTLGAEGGLLVSREGVWRARAPNVAIRSAVGAGDSFTAGLAWAMTNGQPLHKAFALGIAAGTAAVLTPGTELCRADDVWRLAQGIEVEEL